MTNPIAFPYWCVVAFGLLNFLAGNEKAPSTRACVLALSQTFY